MFKASRKTIIFAHISVCLFVLSCGSTPPTIEPVTITGADVIYYDIRGATESELRAQLDALGPVGYDGFKGDATTEWFIHWNWPGYGSSSCDLSATTTSLDMKVILPRWSPPHDASPELVSKWTNYVQMLILHEKGHVDYVIENFQSVQAAIQGATCDSADAAGTVMLEKLRQHDVDYDAVTLHGATQGAVFP